MMKFNIKIVFIGISAIWLIYFSYQFIRYNGVRKEILFIQENESELGNLKFYEKSIRNLTLEFDEISRQSFTSKSTSEFISKLPKIADLSGIKSITLENLGVSREENLEITKLKIMTISDFPRIASFVDFLERSKLPIQISVLKMKSKNNNIYTTMELKIYKKVLNNNE